MRVSIPSRNIMVTEKRVHYISERKSIEHNEVPFVDFELMKWVEAINGRFFSALVFEELSSLNAKLDEAHSRCIYESIMRAYQKDMIFDIAEYIGKFLVDPKGHCELFEQDTREFFNVLLSN